MYANDTWRLSPKWTINLGLRYDKNDGVDGGGATVADDSRISPRIGASWDIQGDGNWVINASAARYVTAIANSVASRGGAGVPNWVGYQYSGPFINMNADGTAQCGDDHPELCMYPTPEALAIMFEWFEAQGGIENTDLWYSQPAIRGVSEVVENLDSPYADELSIGFSKRLGTRDMFRLDYVHREYHDFYSTERNLDTGQVHWEGELADGVPAEADFDFGVVVNEDDLLKREYNGLHTAFQYRFNDKLQVGGTYTYSKSKGNFDGETSGGGPSTSGVLGYPEYNTVGYYDDGYLGIDQRHKLRAWLSWDFISTSRWNMNVSWLENFWSGSPYGATGTALVGAGFWIDNPGYLSPPTWGSYRFKPRDAYLTEDVHRTDLALNFSFFVGKSVEIFLQPEVLNVFNESAIVDVNTKVDTRRYGNDAMSYFNSLDPSVTPVEGVNYTFGEVFGEPENDGDFQTPRIIRFSVGIRF